MKVKPDASENISLFVKHKDSFVEMFQYLYLSVSLDGIITKAL